ncbi:RNA-binding S4 domain-containing protein [Tepidibacter formicigenes]|jgi:ribosome-associated protein|uniref:Ribosome-associated protein n=1 Tax=Tepidibacter formicigenes DSM 15518 TaxID=1123349 RepID=A0A1M6P7S7_9FIRM|nr:RNA-binding S4 domain-containing protein [Tepidibacter formicigenes]SHK04027.1 ribosome-associated protein [Tepidibacter formicigenes DSM 15518]
MKEIKINSDFIKLDQLLKLIDIASTGGHAKIIIQEGEVKVNGKVEYQRGKKIKSGDIIDVQGMSVKVL